MCTETSTYFTFPESICAMMIKFRRFSIGVGFGTEEDKRRVHDDDHGRTFCMDRDHGIEAAMAATAVATQAVIMSLFFLWR